jgi:hypothetical protein
VLALILACTPLPLWADDPDTPPLTPTQPTPLADSPRTLNAPVPQSTPEATATPEPTPTHTVQPGTSHIAVLASECVVPVGDVASSDVFVQLTDVRPGIVRLRLVLNFDPQIVHVQDADGNPANGTQVALAPFFEGQQTTYENLVDNDRGEIALTLGQLGGTGVEETSSWRKVATIAWIGRQAGNSPLTVSEQSRFTATDGRDHPASARHHSTVFVRLPGKIAGAVLLQGRTEHGNTLVTASLSAGRVDRGYTAADGSFALTVSQGEGFYTVAASATGYLTAKGNRPVKLTVGSEVDLGQVTLLGGDVNGDDQIDIRDLSYVAYHLGETDAQSDVNGDGQVDILDLTLIAGNFGTKGPTSWPTLE